MRVYRADDIGLPFVEIGECVVAVNTCTFTTNHFSVFAISPIPTPVSFISSGGGPGGPAFVSVNSLIPSIQNLLSVPQSSSSNTAQEKANSVEHYIASLKRQMVLKYLLEQKYDETISSSQNAESIIVKPILEKVQTISNRGERLISYDFVIHALETEKIKTASSYERKVLSTALQKIMTERITYIQDAFKK